MATTSIALTETPHIRTLLSLADDALVLGHRTSEWTGHAPVLEEELALANIALDLIGQARMMYQAAGELTGHSEDELAYLRDPPMFRNALIMELPNGDFAFTIARLFLVSVASDQRWRAGFGDPALSAIAEKAMKETAYHVRHAAEWLIRLGDGTSRIPSSRPERHRCSVALHRRNHDRRDQDGRDHDGRDHDGRNPCWRNHRSPRGLATRRDGGAAPRDVAPAK